MLIPVPADASIIRPSDDNGRSAGNTPGSSRAYPVDIPGPRKLEIRLLLILWAPERRVRRPPAQAICIFSSYWLFGLDARNGPITLLLCLDQAGSLAAQTWHLHRIWANTDSMRRLYERSLTLASLGLSDENIWTNCRRLFGSVETLKKVCQLSLWRPTATALFLRRIRRRQPPSEPKTHPFSSTKTELSQSPSLTYSPVAVL
jgi:hypothetical protein